jgi:hypothetical protein
MATKITGLCPFTRGGASRTNVPPSGRICKAGKHSTLSTKILRTRRKAILRGEAVRVHPDLAPMRLELDKEHRMLKDLVHRFVETALLPHEPGVLERGSSRGFAGAAADIHHSIDAVAGDMVCGDWTLQPMSAAATFRELRWSE